MKLIPFYHARIVFNYQYYKAVISTNSLNNMSLHTSLIPPTHKITEDHKEHTELSKMLIVNMHTCTKVVVKTLSVIIIYIKEEIKEIKGMALRAIKTLKCNIYIKKQLREYAITCTVTACICACTHAWHLACMHVCWCVCLHSCSCYI